MSKAREMSELVTTALSQASASTTYATQASLATIDADNNPDILMNMGG
jgi:hypothetical protein